MNAIEVKNCNKSYADFKLEHVNFSVEEGTVMGLVGENGAGKSTLIKCILNSIKKESGEVKIFNQDITRNEKSIKERIGVVLDGCFFPETLNAKNIGKIMKCFYTQWDQDLYETYCTKFELPMNKVIKNFSKGMRMKLMIACALCHHAEILILDEPTSGLDPIVRNEILEIFRDFIQDEKHTILISSHITSDLEHIADYITFIDHGKIVLSESYSALSNEYGILRCDEKMMNQLNKNEILRVRKNRYSMDVLVKDSESILRRFPDAIIDRGSIEDLMVLFVKGEKE